MGSQHYVDLLMSPPPKKRIREPEVGVTRRNMLLWWTERPHGLI